MIRELIFVGNNREGSFRNSDLKLITSPKWRQKLIKSFSCPYDFNIIIVNVGPDGIYTGDMKSKLHYTYDTYIPNIFTGIKEHPQFNKSPYDFVYNKSRVSFEFINKLTKRNDLELDKRITVVLTNNEGDNRVPFTPWMVAHRINHLLCANNLLVGTIEVQTFLKDLMLNFPTINPSEVMKEIGISNAQRQNKFLNLGEFFIELGVYYIRNGHIVFPKLNSNFLEKIDLYEQISNTTTHANLNELIDEYGIKFTKMLKNIISDSRRQCFIL